LAIKEIQANLDRLKALRKIGVNALARLLTFGAGFILAMIGSARPQDVTRGDAGITGSTLFNTRFSSTTDVGLGGWFNYNLSPAVGLEAQVESYLTNTSLSQSNPQFGGRATLAIAGFKIGTRTRKYGFFFKASPGILSFSNALTSASVVGSTVTSRKTHAALDLGVVSEAYFKGRGVVRFDVGTLLVRYGDSTPLTLPSGVFIRTNGSIDPTWHIVVGAGYRFGEKESYEEQSRTVSSFSMGAQYSLFTLQRSLFTVRDESGVGGWFSWQFTRNVGIDASVNYFPRQVNFVDFQQGGKIVQVLAGARAGIRRGHVGVFAKCRPGIQLYTDTIQNETTENTSSFTNFAIDVGGIIEVYTSHHTMLRFDAGDTIVAFRSRDIIDTSGETAHIAGFTQNTIQLTGGFGFRF
jgi:hypothetical protein